MLGIVFGLVGLYLWEATGRDDYTPPVSGEDSDNASGEQSFQGEGYINFASQWSPDGNFIAFTSVQSENFGIWVVSSDGSSFINLTENSGVSGKAPNWSPNSQLIAFESMRSGNGDIWIMGADGSNPVNLTSESDETEYAAQWSPDGHYIAYLAETDQRFQVRVVDVESGQITTVAAAPDRDYVAFDWSPNVTQIAVVETMVTENDGDANSGPLTQVSIRSVDGFSLQTYRPTQPVSDVKWSPDGSKFLLEVTTSLGPTALDFIIMNFDGSEQEIVIPEHYGILGNWSLDGSMIVFSTTRSLTDNLEAAVSSIWVSNADGSSLLHIAEDFDGSASPDWSPEGMKIAFSGRQGGEGNFDIWVMNADGSNLMNLTGGE
jgi:TolB protein